MAHSKTQAGDKHFKLTAVEFHSVTYSGNHKWIYKCDCSNFRIANASEVRKGSVKQCRICSKKQNIEMLAINTKKVADKKRETPILAAINQTIGGYKNNAKQRGLEYALSKEQFLYLAVLPCTYCKREKLNTTKSRNNNGDFHYTGIDRVDSIKGYIFDNCVPCCVTCNRAKDNMPLEDFIAWIKLIHATIMK